MQDAYDRIRQEVSRITAGATAQDLAYRPGVDANSIAWLLWHLTRVMDDHVSEIAGREQTWVAGGWREVFDLPLTERDTGYGHTSQQVGQVTADAEKLIGYHEAVQAEVSRYLTGVDAEELDRIIDERWDPPVSVGVRLVSVIGDGLQHVGQAAYVLGMSRRAGP